MSNEVKHGSEWSCNLKWLPGCLAASWLPDCLLAWSHLWLLGMKWVFVFGIQLAPCTQANNQMKRIKYVKGIKSNKMAGDLKKNILVSTRPRRLGCFGFCWRSSVGRKDVVYRQNQEPKLPASCSSYSCSKFVAANGNSINLKLQRQVVQWEKKTTFGAKYKK